MRPRHVVRAGAVVTANAAVAFAARGGIRSVEDAPHMPVAIVLGAQVHDGRPMAFLRGRLDTTAALFHAGKADRVLASGNGNGKSGDEITAMTEYLVEQGVPRSKILGDPLGLRTFDTCERAVQVFGYTRALVVTQAFHVPRTVALARKVGLDAIGIESECDCSALGYVKNAGREWFLARPRAVVDLIG